jgi:hypothetical protein
MLFSKKRKETLPMYPPTDDKKQMIIFICNLQAENPAEQESPARFSFTISNFTLENNDFPMNLATVMARSLLESSKEITTIYYSLFEGGNPTPLDERILTQDTTQEVTEHKDNTLLRAQIIVDNFSRKYKGK